MLLLLFLHSMCHTLIFIHNFSVDAVFHFSYMKLLGHDLSCSIFTGIARLFSTVVV